MEAARSSGETIAHALFRQSRLRPQQAALIAADGSSALTYGELWDLSVAAARYLLEEGIQPGDRVLLSAESSPLFAAAYFGVHLARAVAVPVDTAAPLARIRELLRRSGPKLVVGRVIPAAEGELQPKSLALDELTGLKAEKSHPPLPSPEDFSDLLFTSGTSGRPKGVLLTHRNTADAAAQINAVIGNLDGDTEVVPLPLNHSFGLARLRCNVLAGGTIVLCRGFRLPGETIAALTRYRATGLVGVPAGFAILLRLAEEELGELAGQIRYIEIGSAPMPLAHKQRLRELLPHTGLWMHYGLTEASRASFIEFHRSADRLDSIGKVRPGIEHVIRNERGDAVPEGQPGTLWLRGPSVAAGYWDDPELTAARFVDGWLSTGDIATADADGFLYLHGRSDDMINVGGYNVAPDEVEAALMQHEAIADAACIAIPDPRGIAGSAVAACLVLRRGQTPPEPGVLSLWLAERLEPYKIPTRYEWIAEVPRTGSGKIMRSSLRNAAFPSR